MPAFTSNLNLYKPGGGSTGTIVPDEVVDIDRINQNSDLIDAAVGALQAKLVDAGKIASFPWDSPQGAAANTALTVTSYKPVQGAGDLVTQAGGIFTFTKAGLYAVLLNGASDGASTDKFLFLTKNGTAQHLIHHALTSARFRYNCVAYHRFAVGDTVRVRFLRGTTDFIGANPDDDTLPAISFIYVGV